MRATIGLDFGTSNTLCAWVDDDQPVIIPNRKGERASPSIIAKTANGEILVGSSAKNHVLTEPLSVLTEIKKKLGKVDKLKFGNAEIDSVEAASVFLKKIKTESEEYLGFAIKKAVVCVPARFAEVQRRAVRLAVEKAGMEVARIINEPSAAALARAVLAKNTNSHNVDKLVLVYDFGGGTFDVSLLKESNGQYRVISSEGDDSLGGTDIDKALYKYVAKRFCEEYGVNPEKDMALGLIIMDLCEKTKIELSGREEASLAIPFINGPKGLVHPAVSINREQFNSIIEPIVERSMELVARVLKDCSLKPEDIDSLVLSGGSSRIPLVRDGLEKLLGLAAEPRINPEEIVALGAAIEAARIDGKYPDLEFIDVSSRSFGLELDDGSFVPLIAKNAALPASGKRLFTTVEDYQQSVELHVLQSDSLYSTENPCSVGRFLLPGIRYAKKGEARIAVEFSIDEGDMLLVKARDLDTKSEQSVFLLGGTKEEYPPKYRLGILAKTAIMKAEGLVLDSALASELKELTDKAVTMDADNPMAESLAELLEGLISELASRRMSQE
ncbi:molecular chaperone DnaK [Spirochaetota bacterium]